MQERIAFLTKTKNIPACRFYEFPNSKSRQIGQRTHDRTKKHTEIYIRDIIYWYVPESNTLRIHLNL